MEAVNAISIPRRHEPAKIVELKVGDGDSVEKDTPLLLYEYRRKVDPDAPLSTDPVLDQVLRKSVDASGFMSKREYLNAPFDGKVTAVLASAGDTVKYGDALLEITQPCGHDVVFNGLCSICGKDMTASGYSGANLSRANINMSHDAKGLRVSYQEATRLESETMQRLWKARKLSLIIDLDQTIIHAFATQDPNFETWLVENYDSPHHTNDEFAAPSSKEGAAAEGNKDEGAQPQTRPAHGHLPSDIGSFVLPDSPLRYYIKLRPALREFLEKISKLYEMHIYTMGTRHYAEAVAATIDPERRYFKERILSRDESGSMTHKTLRRLFPCDTSMVVALDDRADVWMWSPNLIKVQPYQFFSGVGDINQGMLPPTAPMPAIPKPEMPAAPETLQANGDTIAAAGNDETVTPTDNGAGSGGGGGEAVAERQISLNEEQLKQDTQRLTQEHKALSDSDRELVYMEDVLIRLHQSYYEKLKPNNQPPLPDVTSLLPRMKLAVLQGVNLVFSAVIPIHPGAPPPQKSDLWRWAEQFGAHCEAEVSRHTTHVVAGKRDTAKVHKARRLRHSHKGTSSSSPPLPHKHHPPIVVNIGWLIDSMSQWSKLDEIPYLWYPDEDRAIVEEAHRQAAQNTSGAQDSDDDSSLEDDDESGDSEERQSAAAEQPPASVIESMSSFIVPSNGDQPENSIQVDSVQTESSRASKSRKRKSGDLIDTDQKPRPQAAALQRLKSQAAPNANGDDYSGTTTDIENEIEKQEAGFRIHEAEVEDYLHKLDWDDVERELDEFMNESDSDDGTGRSRPRTPEGGNSASHSHSSSAVNLRQVAMRQARNQRIASKNGRPDVAENGKDMDDQLADGGVQTDSSDVYGESSSGSETDEHTGGHSPSTERHRMKRRKTSPRQNSHAPPRSHTSRLTASDGAVDAGTNGEDGDFDEEDDHGQETNNSPESSGGVRQRLAKSLGMSAKPMRSILDDNNGTRIRGADDDDDGEDDDDEFESAGEARGGYQEDNEDDAEDNDDDDDDDGESEQWGEDDDDDDENFDDLINKLEDDISDS